MSTFYAELEGGAVIAESGPFRERKRTDGPSAAAQGSHRELLARLEELGWELTDEAGPDWYEATLQRPLEIREMDVAGSAADDAPPPPQAPVRPIEPQMRPVHRHVPQAAPGARQAPLEAAPAGTPAPARSNTMRWKKTAGTVAGLAAVAGAASIALAASGPSQPQVVPSHAASHTAADRETSAQPAAVPVASPVTARSTVHVTIAARSRQSWLEVRRRSARGAVLFSGELSAGRRLRFTGTRLWARLGAAGNLAISVDGKPLVLQGTYEHVFVAHQTSR
jgi:hypothetical protein